MEARKGKSRKEVFVSIKVLGNRAHNNGQFNNTHMHIKQPNKNSNMIINID